MKYSQIFDKLLGCKNEDEVFAYLIDNLKETIKSWDYFVNWQKVCKNYHEAEISLNLLNTLIGKPDIEKAAEDLLTEYPKVIKIIPALVAERHKKISLLGSKNDFNTTNFDFTKLTSAKDGVKFMKESGFLSLVSDRAITSIPNYFFGVEVGLDSNGRKNRSGTAMESLIELFIKDICKRNGYEYIAQATANKIYTRWGKNITVTNSSKRIDFAINTPHKLYLLETNFYGDGGSKIKSTAGEYAKMYQQWSKDGHQFIWITDGLGWQNAQYPLRDTFDTTDYILNIAMIQKGILETILKI